MNTAKQKCCILKTDSVYWSNSRGDFGEFEFIPNNVLLIFGRLKKAWKKEYF